VRRTTSAAGVTFTRSHLTPSFTGRFFPDWQQPARVFSRDARGWLLRAWRPRSRCVALLPPSARGPHGRARVPAPPSPDRYPNPGNPPHASNLLPLPQGTQWGPVSHPRVGASTRRRGARERARGRGRLRPLVTPDAPQSQLGRKVPGPGNRASSHGSGGRLPGCPTRTTGVPNKYVRPDAGRPRRQSAQTSRNSLPTGRARTYRGPRQMLPGSPTSTTGAPDKCYRGPQQALPGSPTSTTGVPNKRPFLKLLQNGGFLVVFRDPFVFVSLCSVMLFNNNYRENGEVYPWGQTASN
jgi:hypothetical protein